jgi:hypothetical protein
MLKLDLQQKRSYVAENKSVKVIFHLLLRTVEMHYAENKNLLPKKRQFLMLGSKTGLSLLSGNIAHINVP